MKRVVAYLFLTSIAFAQFDQSSPELPNDTLAKIGSTIITSGDFLERFELMPWPNKDKKERIEFSKLEFLYSMTAEKLLAMEATSLNIGSDSTSLKFQNNYERLFVRDAYYKNEIQPKIIIPEQEIAIGMTRFPDEIEVEVLGILSKSEGDLLYKKITQSKNKKARLRYFLDSLYIPIDTLQVSYGFSDVAIEDAVFSIGKDSISRPIETQPYGWVMFSLLRRYSNVKNTAFSHPDRLHKVKNIIKQRKEDSLALRTFADVTAKQRAEANPEIFFPLADTVYSILAADSANYLSKGVYQFPSTAIAEVETKIAGRLHEDFITIESGNMTLGEVLTGLSNNNVVFPAPLNLDYLRIVLNNNIKTVIQNEMLAREGLKKNLQQTQSVRHDISVWMDNRKSWLLLKKVIDTIQTNADSVQRKRMNEYVQESLNKYIGSLAKKYNVVVNETVLRNVPTTTTNMVTWRYIGFGGRIVAVPQVIRQFEWKYEWQKQEQINQ